MRPEELLGMRLEDALEILRAQGEQMQVAQSRGPRVERDGGTLRVVRVRPGQMTVCAFLDGAPED